MIQVTTSYYRGVVTKIGCMIGLGSSLKVREIAYENESDVLYAADICLVLVFFTVRQILLRDCTSKS